MDVKEIVSVINARAPDFRFGDLQDIRKTRKPLPKRPCLSPFYRPRENQPEDWAIHAGGRSELQFNIGRDENLLRWGLAISLQTSQSLTDVTQLFPRVRKLSTFLETHGDHLHRRGFDMWDWIDVGRNRRRSADRVPQQISADLYSRGTAIFLGKRAPIVEFDPDVVLQDFDELLPIYEFVEFESVETPPALYADRGFVFKPNTLDYSEREYETTVSFYPRVTAMSFRHRQLQDALKRELEQEGAQVSVEHRDGKGGFIDVVAFRDGATEFYEIKTSGSVRLAFREAIGQLLEYALWPPSVTPSPNRLVVVAEHPLASDDFKYIHTLSTQVGLAVEYRQVKLRLHTV